MSPPYETVVTSPPDNDDSIQEARSVPRNFDRPRVNSLEHFADSFSRAQSFRAMGGLNRSRSFFYEDDSSAVIDDDDDDDYDETATDYSSHTDHERSPLLGVPNSRPDYRRHSSYTVPVDSGSHLLSESELGSNNADSEPVIVRKVEDAEGKISTMVVGQSTAPQTIFNSVNVLIGVGLLSLPLGFKYAGWGFGFLFLLGFGLTTVYSAILLAKCLDTDPTLVTYADIAYAAFGKRARILVSALFSIELLGSGVSLMVLFADSLNALFPNLSTTTYKIIGFLIMTPTCYLPLRILSFSSILGIICTVGLVLIVVYTGITTDEAPGSLITNPMDTTFWPKNWMTVPLSIGIFMSPWGGHAVFPNIYRDMRHPRKYKQCLVTIYEITFMVDISMGVLGFLMYGDQISDEVTKNILNTTSSSGYISYAITILVGMIPLAKVPLNARPIVSTLDVLLGLNGFPLSKPVKGVSMMQKIIKFNLRILVVFIFSMLAIVFPEFDRIIAFAGSALCVTTCLLLPFIFYLKIYDGKISRTETIVLYIFIILSALVGSVGTIWSLIPQEYLGLKY